MTEPTQSDVVWLTQAKYDELKAELEELRGPTRAELVKRVSDARDEGDLKENAGYHAARDELGKIDGRVQQLVDMLERAKVGETPADDGVVEPGMKVTVKLVGLDLEETFLFGAREMAGDDINGLLPAVPAGPGDRRRQARRDRHLQPAQRQGAEGRDRRGRPLRRLSSTRLLDDVVAVLAQPATTSSACSGPLVSSCRRTSTSPMCSDVEVRSCGDLEDVGARRRRARRAGARARPGRSGITQRRLR